MFDWVKRIIEKRNLKAEKEAFKEEVYSDDNRSIIDNSTLSETDTLNKTNESVKKTIRNKASEKRKKDLDALEEMNNNMNSQIKGLF
jgi:hypothetical protein